MSPTRIDVRFHRVESNLVVGKFAGITGQKLSKFTDSFRMTLSKYRLFRYIAVDKDWNSHFAVFCEYLRALRRDDPAIHDRVEMDLRIPAPHSQNRIGGNEAEPLQLPEERCLDSAVNAGCAKNPTGPKR